MKKNITVNIFDTRGELLGTFVPNTSLKSPRLTHDQLLAYYDSEHRISIAKEIVLASIHNELLNIRYHNKLYTDPKYESSICALKKFENEYQSRNKS